MACCGCRLALRNCGGSSCLTHLERPVRREACLTLCLVATQHGKLDEAVENLLTLEKQCRLVRCACPPPTLTFSEP